MVKSVDKGNIFVFLIRKLVGLSVYKKQFSFLEAQITYIQGLVWFMAHQPL